MGSAGAAGKSSRAVIVLGSLSRGSSWQADEDFLDPLKGYGFKPISGKTERF